ncbi:serine/threonine-protein kinase [Actinomycetes bacterium KLBMP 9797]
MTGTRPGALPLPVVPGLSELSVLARGGYATVYRATQVSVAREVAVKVENRTLDNERDQRRFLREARAAGRMSSHPHVVDLFDAGVTADRHPYLIMELCEGSYAERMRRAPLDAAEARDVGVKIADALADAHHLGVLHRDVKPANILHSRFGEPALADFGLAIIAEARDPSVTLEVLTPAYAPPEMFRHSAPSPAVDVYALCATLYAVLRGKPPRWYDDRNPSLLTLVDLFNQPIPDLPGVPRGLLDLLRQGMANDPAARPSAAELRDALAGLSLSSGTPPAGVYVSRGYPPPKSTDDSTPTVPARRVRRWKRWWFAALGAVALVAALAAGGWYALAGDKPSDASRALPGCAVPLGNGRCPDGEECFGPIRVDGPTARAERVSCESRHTWEAYAVGDLPKRLVGAAPGEVASDGAVRGLCNRITFTKTTLLVDTRGWVFEVLPDGGTFHCLAGKGPGALSDPTLSQ